MPSDTTIVVHRPTGACFRQCRANAEHGQAYTLDLRSDIPPAWDEVFRELGAQLAEIAPDHIDHHPTLTVEGLDLERAHGWTRYASTTAASVTRELILPPEHWDDRGGTPPDTHEIGGVWFRRTWLY